MRKFLLLNGGSRWINLELVREITQTSNGMTLRFDAAHTITLEGQEARDCMEAVNRMNGYESPTANRQQPTRPV